MIKPNASNERVKREYFRFLREAKGRDVTTVDRVAMALTRFEISTGRRDFRRFHREQAIAFKRRLTESVISGGERLSKATAASILRDLKTFFEWLSREPQYRSKVQFSDADYFSLSSKDAAIARARRPKAHPSVEQVARVLSAMPAETVLERRNRAVVAFAALTGARVNALATFRLGHVNTAAGYVEQDARLVKTKFAKTFRTYFMPVVEGSRTIIEQWVKELRDDHNWRETDPLFPATLVGVGADGAFAPQGIAREAWKSTQPIRDIFRRGFEMIGAPYFNPHTMRDMLVHHAMRLDLTPAQMKAWSQNLGHEAVLTTFTSYGQIPFHQQGDLIQASAAATSDPERMDTASLLAVLTQRITNRPLGASGA